MSDGGQPPTPCLGRAGGSRTPGPALINLRSPMRPCVPCSSLLAGFFPLGTWAMSLLVRLNCSLLLMCCRCLAATLVVGSGPGRGCVWTAGAGGLLQYSRSGVRYPGAVRSWRTHSSPRRSFPTAVLVVVRRVGLDSSGSAASTSRGGARRGRSRLDGSRTPRTGATGDWARATGVARLVGSTYRKCFAHIRPAG